MKNTEVAFHWIVGIFREHKIPFLIFGGFAARLYGATRKLADIDIDISEDRFPELVSHLQPYATFGPARYLDENWDLLLMTLVYQGQEIDICGAYEAKIFDQTKREWINLKADFFKAQIMNVYGTEVPVISREDLMGYKKKLAREVDLIDVAQMSNGGAIMETMKKVT